MASVGTTLTNPSPTRHISANSARSWSSSRVMAYRATPSTMALNTPSIVRRTATRTCGAWAAMLANFAAIPSPADACPNRITPGSTVAT